MSKNENLCQVYAAVRVVDDTLERNGQVGVYIGPGAEPDESLVRFDDDVTGQHDSFANTSLQVL
jgi:hypothetical protein